MYDRHQISRALEDFGASIGLADLRFDDNGLCSVEVRDVAVLTFFHDEDARHGVLFANLVELPKDRGAATMRMMLEANAMWRGADGATLALEPERGVILLQKAIADDDLEAARFKRFVEGFIAQAASWLSRIASGHAATAAERGPVELPTYSIRV